MFWNTVSCVKMRDCSGGAGANSSTRHMTTHAIAASARDRAEARVNSAMRGPATERAMPFSSA